MTKQGGSGGRRLVSSECVLPGHADKIADQIADALVDEMLSQDEYGRCGCEILVNSQLVVISGEFKTSANLDAVRVARNTIGGIGYTDAERLGFSADECAYILSVRDQSPEIGAAVAKLAASDQGVIYGYACSESDSFLPLPLHLARKVVARLDTVRRDGTLPYLRPDGKAQVTVEYCGNERRIRTVVVAAQHDPDVDMMQVRNDLTEHVIAPLDLAHGDVEVIINGLGRFVLGGPAIDTGVTGRKLAADTYGGIGRTGGGALCGKDPTKLDRTGAYYGRYVAKNIVAAGLAARCQVEIAFAFGKVDPVATSIETFGTNRVPEDEILALVRDAFVFTPAGMVDELNLRKPVYSPTAARGHFGDPGYSWEDTSVAARLRAASTI